MAMDIERDILVAGRTGIKAQPIAPAGRQRELSLDFSILACGPVFQSKYSPLLAASKQRLSISIAEFNCDTVRC